MIRLLKKFREPEKEEVVVSVSSEMPMPSEMIKQEYTEEQRFNLKWNAIMTAIFLKEQYGMTPKEMKRGVDLFKCKGVEIMRHLMYMTSAQNQYNENPLGEILTDEYLEKVCVWTREEFYARREEDKKRLKK